MSTEENKYQYNHLEELNGSDYQIVEGEPDITGWEVLDGAGSKVGDVDDVLFDPQSREVRYIIVDLEDNDLELKESKKVLVPIGIAELQGQYDDDTVVADTEVDDLDGDADDDDDIEDEVVILPIISIDQLRSLPAYEKGTLSPEHEMAIRRVFEPTTTETALVVYEKDSFYTHDQFNNRLYPGLKTGRPQNTGSDLADDIDFDESGRNKPQL